MSIIEWQNEMAATLFVWWVQIEPIEELILVGLVLPLNERFIDNIGRIIILVLVAALYKEGARWYASLSCISPSSISFRQRERDAYTFPRFTFTSTFSSLLLLVLPLPLSSLVVEEEAEVVAILRKVNTENYSYFESNKRL
jgi:hypothetical protein